MSDVGAQKITSLQRCVARAREAYAGATDIATDYNLQDAAVLNVIRACELAIDLANMLIRNRQLGIPADSRESFALLARENLIPQNLYERLRAMVGFRNLAVHQYRKLDLAILRRIIESDLDDVLRFAECIRRAGDPA